ncbi:MAG: hypothetical protein MJY82_08340 [Fibrobacter sp.]|nr:hypothetical protein [Fibrobacter sp.]
MNFKVFAAAAALLASQSFAIIGIGGHYTPGFGTEMKGMDKAEPITKDGSVLLKHGDFKGTMQGFGFKLWVDILPIIDVEATINFRMGSYDANLYVTNPVSGEVTDIPLEIELGGTPFGKANPKFVSMNGDLSITYPITSLPIIRPYIGGGLTYYLNTFVLNPQFAEPLVDGTVSAILEEIATMDTKTVTDPAQQEALKQKVSSLGETMKQKVQDQALKEGLKKSIGGHVLLGVRAKLPIIPIAVYANGKMYFGGDYPDEIDAGMFAAELGVGFAL